MSDREPTTEELEDYCREEGCHYGDSFLDDEDQEDYCY